MVRLRDDEMEWQELDGEVVVLDLRCSKYFVVNGSGAHLWLMMTEHRTLDELADALVDRYDLPSSTALDDARAFVRSLHDRDLLVR